MCRKPVTILLREISRNPVHVCISVFVGRNPGARGRAGELILRADEWDEICNEIQSTKEHSMIDGVINFAADKIEVQRKRDEKEDSRHPLD